MNVQFEPGPEAVQSADPGETGEPGGCCSPVELASCCSAGQGGVLCTVSRKRMRLPVGDAHRLAVRRLHCGAPSRGHRSPTMHDGTSIQQLRQAVANLDGSGRQLELARAHAELGAALRRAGCAIEARESLRIAVDLAHRRGERALEEWALAELRAAGARPRRRLISGAAALTPSERRITELAAAGHRNRDIAESLVVTLGTVEFHLRHAYRKLGIVSRTKLKDVLPAQPATVGVHMPGGSVAALETGSTYRWERRSSAATSTSWARAQ